VFLSVLSALVVLFFIRVSHHFLVFLGVLSALVVLFFIRISHHFLVFLGVLSALVVLFFIRISHHFLVFLGVLSALVVLLTEEQPLSFRYIHAITRYLSESSPYIGFSTAGLPSDIF